MIKQTLLVISYLLLMQSAFGQTDKKVPKGKKYANEKNYKDYVPKAKLNIKAKQAVSLLLDDFFVYNTLGLGYQRKEKKFLFDFQISVPVGNMLGFQRGFLEKNLTSTSLLGLKLRETKFDTAKCNYGLQLGAYKQSAFSIGTTGFLYGLTATYTNFSVNYLTTDRGLPVRANNTANRIGAFFTVGSRYYLTSKIGICNAFGIGLRSSSFGSTKFDGDKIKNQTFTGLASFGNFRIFIFF
jgi:hypothetical protein